jgi:hypothetical protein
LRTRQGNQARLIWAGGPTDMTKTEWQATRKWCDDLAAVTGMDHETYPTGFIYRDGGEHIEARGSGFGVVIGTTEAEFKTIEEAEDYLWAEWAEAECEETVAVADDEQEG